MLRSIRTIRNIPRMKDISVVLMKHGLYQVGSLLGAPIRVQLRRLWSRPFEEPLTQAERLRLAFQELGPTFIKLGQLIASRPDLFPEPFVEEFSKLESRVDPLPFADIHAVLEQALGCEPAQHFRTISQQPIAAASIAQIHRATTVDGEEVVLKVQKPGAASIIGGDLEILSLVVEALTRGFEDLAILDLEEVVAEVRRALERELNFIFELNAMERVRGAFEGDRALVVPKTYRRLSSKRLLVMEFLDGTSIRTTALTSEEAHRVAREYTRILFEMIFRDGHFHADPHASNVLLLGDGRLGWVDFGSMGLLTKEMREALTRLLRALLRRDYVGVARQVMRLGRARGDTSLAEFTQDLAVRIDPFFGLTIDEIDIGSLFKTIMGLARDHQIAIAPGFIVMTRGLLLMEGVVHRLAPDLNTMEELEPLVKRHLLERYRPDRVIEEAGDRVFDTLAVLSEYPANIGEILRKMAQGRFQADMHVRGLEQLTRRFEVSTNHIVQALIVSALLVSSSMVLTASESIGPELWGLPILGLFGYLGAGVIGVWIVFSILRR